MREWIEKKDSLRFSRFNWIQCQNGENVHAKRLLIISRSHKPMMVFKKESDNVKLNVNEKRKLVAKTESIVRMS